MAATSAGVENDTDKPVGGAAAKLGVAEVKTSMVVWLDSPTRTGLAGMAAASGAASITTTPSAVNDTRVRRSVFTGPR